MARRSVYERRRFGWRDKLLTLVGRDEPAQVVFNADGNATFVVGTGAESGRIVGVLLEDGTVLRFPEPDPRRPEEWPESYWTRVVVRRTRGDERRAI